MAHMVMAYTVMAVINVCYQAVQRTVLDWFEQHTGAERFFVSLRDIILQADIPRIKLWPM